MTRITWEDIAELENEIDCILCENVSIDLRKEVALALRRWVLILQTREFNTGDIKAIYKYNDDGSKTFIPLDRVIIEREGPA